MVKIIQVGAGSGGMPVLDLVCRDPRITGVTLVEPDVYKPHNVVRHIFAASEIGENKADLASRWLRDRCPQVEVCTISGDLLDPALAREIEKVALQANMGICAADNEPAKFGWDALMRKARLPWTLGEVLSGGIGGFIHWFRPGGPCYGCVASYLQRAVAAPSAGQPDYSQPGGPREETSVPASAASIHTIAALHAQITLDFLADPVSYDPGFTSLLFTLQRVPGMFEEAFRPYRFTVPRANDCLFCASTALTTAPSTEELDVELDRALTRLGHA